MCFGKNFKPPTGSFGSWEDHFSHKGGTHGACFSFLLTDMESSTVERCSRLKHVGPNGWEADSMTFTFNRVGLFGGDFTGEEIKPTATVQVVLSGSDPIQTQLATPLAPRISLHKCLCDSSHLSLPTYPSLLIPPSSPPFSSLPLAQPRSLSLTPPIPPLSLLHRSSSSSEATRSQPGMASCTTRSAQSSGPPRERACRPASRPTFRRFRCELVGEAVYADSAGCVQARGEDGARWGGTRRRVLTQCRAFSVLR